MLLNPISSYTKAIAIGLSAISLTAFADDYYHSKKSVGEFCYYNNFFEYSKPVALLAPSLCLLKFSVDNFKGSPALLAASSILGALTFSYFANHKIIGFQHYLECSREHVSKLIFKSKNPIAICGTSANTVLGSALTAAAVSAASNVFSK